MEKVFTVLGWLVLATLSMAIARQLSEQKFIVWNEGFLNPADANLNARKPYSLLDTPTKPASLGSMTSKECYEADFMAQNERTGNYSQTTNNFKHKGPDSCSTNLEMVNSIYQN